MRNYREETGDTPIGEQSFVPYQNFIPIGEAETTTGKQMLAVRRASRNIKFAGGLAALVVAGAAAWTLATHQDKHSGQASAADKAEASLYAPQSTNSNYTGK